MAIETQQVPGIRMKGVHLFLLWNMQSSHPMRFEHSSSFFSTWKNSAQQELQTDLISLPSHMHTHENTKINTYTLTHQSRPAVVMAILSLCVALSLFCCREVRNRIHLHAYPESFADEPPMGCGQLFSICHVGKMWTYTKTKNGDTAIDPRKKDACKVCPFCYHFTLRET